jgi:cell division cycle 20-like protein 1, cofactor of APC complex
MPAMGSPGRVSTSFDPSSTSLGGSAKKPKRKISRAPYKVLDAPSLQDDFYLNLVDWSKSNVLAVALGNSVYLWSAYTSKVCPPRSLSFLHLNVHRSSSSMTFLFQSQ